MVKCAPHSSPSLNWINVLTQINLLRRIPIVNLQFIIFFMMHAKNITVLLALEFTQLS